MPAWHIHNIPMRAISQTLRSLYSETHRKPARSISAVAGTAGKSLTELLWTLSKPAELAGGDMNSFARLASSAWTGLIIVLIEPDVVVWVFVRDKPADRTLLWPVIVGEAFAPETANSRNAKHNRLLSRNNLLYS